MIAVVVMRVAVVVVKILVLIGASVAVVVVVSKVLHVVTVTLVLKASDVVAVVTVELEAITEALEWLVVVKRWVPDGRLEERVMEVVMEVVMEWEEKLGMEVVWEEERKLLDGECGRLWIGESEDKLLLG